LSLCVKNFSAGAGDERGNVIGIVSAKVLARLFSL
jgi:hypothetical protein